MWFIVGPPTWIRQLRFTCFVNLPHIQLLCSVGVFPLVAGTISCLHFLGTTSSSLAILELAKATCRALYIWASSERRHTKKIRDIVALRVYIKVALCQGVPAALNVFQSMACVPQTSPGPAVVCAY